MESLTSGTLAGTGSFRCEQCGYVVTIADSDTLPTCPGCTGAHFTRASLFGSTRFQREVDPAPLPERREAQLAEARATISAPGQYLVFDDGGRTRTVALDGRSMRIGRSLSADVRFEDPTISRRHALLVREPDGIRVLDDRSLNGVFVNGERVESRQLADGDEIVLGRYRLRFLEVADDVAGVGSPALDAQ